MQSWTSAAYFQRAGKIQAAADAFGLFFGAGALLVQLHALCAAIVFMSRHAERVPFPSPVLLPSGRPRLAWLITFLAGSKGAP